MEPTGLAMSSSHRRPELYGSDADAEALRDALRTGELPVAVYGLGKMGLPLAAAFAELTGDTIGVDIDPDRVDRINRGECPVEREPGLADLVERTVETGDFRASIDPSDAWAARIHVVLVPTLLDEADHPDLSMLEAAVDAAGAALSPGDLVVVESTVPPGTCRSVVRPRLEAASGLSADEFGVAHCPERTASGRALQDIRGAYPRIVGGVDEASTDAGSLVYDELTDNDVIPVADARTAAAVKVFEGVYRDANIAIANELAGLADELGIDVREAIQAANTQPFCEIHRPGPGVGGHCIPVYPYFLVNGCETDTPLLRTAREVNEGMPAQTVSRLADLLTDAGEEVAGSHVLIFGVAYRAGVDETRFSPGLAIAAELADRGAFVVLADPVVDCTELDYPAVDVDRVQLADFDAAIIATDHEDVASIDWKKGDLVVLDGRGALNVEAAHVHTLGNGRPD